MPWRGPEYPGEFPTLGYAMAEVIEQTCAIPDGDLVGEALRLTDEQLRVLLWMYRLDPVTCRFTYFRGAQLIRPQKWGKGPFGAAWLCGEANPEAPARPAGWDAKGEPVGRPWAKPWMQVTAFSEGQTDNVWRPLLAMIELGALSADIPDTGETRINLPSGGRIEPVTSSARSRHGQPITHALQDETQSWLKENGGRQVADTQRRNLAGMSGRFLALANKWDPTENSVAQQDAETGQPGLYLDDVDPGAGSVYNKRERRRMLRKVYGDSWWVDLDRIDAEIETLLPRDPDQAERFFLNRAMSQAGAAFDHERWSELADEGVIVPDGAVVTLGIDGARFEDAIAIIATRVGSGHQWPVGIWERPEAAGDDYEHPPREIDGAVAECFERFDVWRAYIDPQWIDHLVVSWQGRYGERRVVPWYTNRPKQAAYMFRNYRDAIQAGDLSHSGDETFARHVGAARKRYLPIFDEQHRRMWTIRKLGDNKIDAAAAGGLSWEARSDAIASGVDERSGAASF